MNKIAHIILSRALDKEFDYSIPDCAKLEKGMRVLVDFRGKRELGIVAGLGKVSRFPKLKPLMGILDDEATLTDEQLQLAKNLCKRYPYSFGEFLFMMLPSYLKKPRSITPIGKCDIQKNQEPRHTFIKGERFAQRYEIWKHIAKDAFSRGSVLICFPQLEYLKEAVKLIEKDFPGKLTIMHSYLTEKELFLSWKNSRLKALVVGTRVSLFYYPRDLDTVIIEEENSPYYFQEEKPYHKLLDLALELSKIKKNSIVLSANYPTIPAYDLIRAGSISLQDACEKVPDIKVVDVREQNKYNTISPVVVELIRKRIDNNGQVVVIWNRKGFGHSLGCSTCGYMLLCTQCSSFLRLHLAENEAVCPYCGKRHTVPKVCPKCQNGYFRSHGLGIEKIMFTLRKIFPHVKIESWERRTLDTQVILTTSKIVSSLYAGEKFDCGILLDVDTMLMHMDYDACFNAFAYIRTLALFFRDAFYIVTRNAGHYLFDCLGSDWRTFYKKELELRKEMRLPPYWSLAKVTLKGVDEDFLFDKAKSLSDDLAATRDIEVYGPFKKEPFKVRGKYNYLLVLKSKKSFFLRKTIKDLVKTTRSAKVRVAAVIE